MYHVSILYEWKEEFKCDCLLTVSIPSLFDNYSNVVLADDDQMPEILYTTVTVLVDIEFLRFVVVSHDGMGFAACVVLLMGCKRYGVLVLF